MPKIAKKENIYYTNSVWPNKFSSLYEYNVCIFNCTKNWAHTPKLHTSQYHKWYYRNVGQQNRVIKIEIVPWRIFEFEKSSTSVCSIKVYQMYSHKTGEYTMSQVSEDISEINVVCIQLFRSIYMWFYRYYTYSNKYHYP